MLRTYLFLILLFYILFLSNVNCKLFPIAVRLPLNGTPPDMGGSLWPKPNEQEFYSNQFYIDKNSFSYSVGSELNVCEKDIVEKLWSHYQNIFFPPRLAYEAPNKVDIVLKKVLFNLKTKSDYSKMKLPECAEKYYPFIQDIDSESCKNIKLFFILK